MQYMGIIKTGLRRFSNFTLLKLKQNAAQTSTKGGFTNEFKYEDRRNYL